MTLVCPTCRLERTPEPGFGACPVCGERLVSPEAVTALVASPDSEEDAPRTIGRYTLDVLLGEGAMGSVWKAYDAHLKRPVALKILRGKDPQDVERLHREARIAASLRHPNIVSVHDVGSADDESFIAMDLVDGESIDRLRLSVRRVLEVVRDAARAVHYAHGRGVVHRDLKPGNLLVDREGRAYVTDFGLAKQTQIDSSMSTIGAVLGTPQFMSPEQAAGKSKEADARSDIWSLGATIYFLLCGRGPFEGKALFEILRRIQEEDPTPLRRHNPRIHGDIETIVMKCLQKESARRYRTAAELAEDLDRFLGGEPIAARPPSTFYRVTRGLRRHKWTVVVMAFALLGAVAAYLVVKDQMRTRGAAGPLKEAETLFAQGRFVEARSKYDDARGRGASIPEDRYARCLEEERRTQWLARREVELGPYLRRCEFAIQKAREARKANPPDYRAWREFVQEGIRSIDEALAKDESWTTGTLARGRAKVEGNDWNGAIADFTLALERDPRDSLARYERGKTYLLKSLLAEKGPERLQEAVDRVTGWLRKALDDFDAGAREGWKMEKEDAEILVVYQLFAASRYEEVDRRTSEILGERPRDLGLLVIRGETLFRLGRYPESKDVFARALQETGAHPVLFVYLARACGLLGDHEGRWDYYNRAVEMDPDFAIGRNNRGKVHLEKGDWKSALEDLNRAVELAPEFAMAYNNRGRARQELGDADGAMADLSRALELDPETYEAYVNRATFVHGKRKDWRRQAQDYGRAIALRPDIPDAWASRGMAWHYLALDQSGEERKSALLAAVADYEHFLSMAPDHPNGSKFRPMLEKCRRMLAEFDR